MRKLLRAILPAMMILVLATAVHAENGSGTPTIMFARYFINFAWGFDFKGITVDSDGNIFSFVSDDSSNLVQSSEAGLTAEELNLYYRPGRKQIGTVKPEELQSMSALLPQVAISSMSESINEACDMGTYAWVGYLQDPSSGRFKKIDLKLKGDWSSHNLATGAQDIVAWLDTLGAGKAE